MIRTMMKTLAAAAALAGMTAGASAAGGATAPLTQVDWSFNGPFGVAQPRKERMDTVVVRRPTGRRFVEAPVKHQAIPGLVLDDAGLHR